MNVLVAIGWRPVIGDLAGLQEIIWLLAHIPSVGTSKGLGGVSSVIEAAQQGTRRLLRGQKQECNIIV